MTNMTKITKEELDEILRSHKLWLNGTGEGARANLSGVDLSHADLSRADLSRADLTSANLCNANLYSATLSSANMTSSFLCNANLSYADLRFANLYHANLCNTDLNCADLSYANLSCAQFIKSNIDFLNEHFEKNEEGYIVYKTFGTVYASPDEWNIAKGSILSENVNFNRTERCGCGINVAPLNLVKWGFKGTIWKCLIRWEWLVGVCCPYNSEGIIRCERIELIEPIATD